MAKRTIEIEDDLDERVQGAIEEVKERLEEEPTDEPNDIIFEVVDGSVPIYNKNISDLWYLYGDEFVQAYKDAGIGDGTENNYQQVAIFCYIEQKVWEWWHDWKDSSDEEEDEEDDEDE